MQRRTFLASLIATAVLDPERLLWVPGQKTISIPRGTVEPWPPREWVWINLRETRATGLFSNGARIPSADVVDFLPVDELDGVCSKAFADFRKFCEQTFGTYTLPEVEPKLLPGASATVGSGVWISWDRTQHERYQKPAW